MSLTLLQRKKNVPSISAKKPQVFFISASRLNIQYFHLVKNSYNASTYQSDAPKCT